MAVRLAFDIDGDKEGLQNVRILNGLFLYKDGRTESNVSECCKAAHPEREGRIYAG